MGAIPPVVVFQNSSVDSIEIADVCDAETLWKLHEAQSSWPTDVNPWKNVAQLLDTI